MKMTDMDHDAADGSLILLLLAIIVLPYCIQMLLRIHKYFSKGNEANVKDIATCLDDDNNSSEQDAVASEAFMTSNIYNHSNHTKFPVINKYEKNLNHRMNDTSIANSEMELHSQSPVEEVIETDLDDIMKWRCVCEQGFLPPGMLKSFSGMESILRTSTGKCYHKTT
jgi:hypothetical protein